MSKSLFSWDPKFQRIEDLVLALELWSRLTVSRWSVPVRRRIDRTSIRGPQNSYR